MVLKFFQSKETALDHIGHQVVGMIGSCRHSFDLAMSAFVTDADITPIGAEVRSTDREINGVEETVRRELVVHMAVTGSSDVGTVLGFLLMVKKLERVGDQAKNVFDLAAEGVRFSGAPDYERFVDFRNRVSTTFADAVAILGNPDEVDPAPMVSRSQELMDTFDELVNELIHSNEPGSFAVPRAMLFRYLKRIVANLVGVVTTMTEGVDRTGDDVDE
ncbi:MAG: PhoU domain-containing protein [Acidimicrobiales bacterium]